MGCDPLDDFERGPLDQWSCVARYEVRAAPHGGSAGSREAPSPSAGSGSFDGGASILLAPGPEAFQREKSRMLGMLTFSGMSRIE